MGNHEIAVTVIYDRRGILPAMEVINNGTLNSVVRDFDAVLDAATDMAEAGGVPCIACYHTHPCGSDTPSMEDQTTHWGYQARAEGHGFIWAGGYIVTRKGAAQFS